MYDECDVHELRTEWAPENVIAGDPFCPPVMPRREPLHVTVAKFDRIRLAVGVDAKR